jgi:hypothetical protein
MIKKVLNDLLTGADNKTHDIARWSWMLSFFAITFGAGYEMIHNDIPTLKDFAEAVGIIAGAHGAAVMLKKDTEPKEHEDVEKPSN